MQYFKSDKEIDKLFKEYMTDFLYLSEILNEEYNDTFKKFDNEIRTIILNFNKINNKALSIVDSIEKRYNFYKQLLNLSGEQAEAYEMFNISGELNKKQITMLKPVFTKLFDMLSGKDPKSLAHELYSTMFHDDFIKAEKQKQRLLKKSSKNSGGRLDLIAFGSERYLPELDNKFEQQLHTAISRHLDHAGMQIQYVTAIRNILKRGIYDDMFTRPNVQKVYRGMGVKYEWLKAAIGAKKGEVAIKNGHIEKRFTWHPKKNAGSWTKSLRTAKRFANENSNMKSGTVPIVMVAYTDENSDDVFLDARLWYKNISDEYSAEREVISLSDIKVSEIMWFDADPENSGIYPWDQDKKQKIVDKLANIPKQSFSKVLKKHARKK